MSIHSALLLIKSTSKDAPRPKTVSEEVIREIAANHSKGWIAYDVPHSKLVEEGNTEIQAAQQIRYHIPIGFLISVDCSTTGAVAFHLYKTTSQFELRQMRLQQMWLTAKDLTSECAAEEAAEIDRAAIVRKTTNV